MAIKFRDELDALRPYVPGKSVIAFDGPIYKLSSNENPLGPSPKAIRTYQEASNALQTYPDGDQAALKAALCKYFKMQGVQKENIITGAGSDSIFEMIGHALLEPKDSIVMPRHGFLIHAMVAKEAGAEVIHAPEDHCTAHVDEILNCISDNSRAIFLANPANPTGTYLNKDKLKSLIDQIPSTILFVLDCAYAEFVLADDYDDGLHYALSRDNVIVTRTFSKIHGLAALRLGYGIGHPNIIEHLNKVRMPFNVTSAAISAGISAVEDRDHVKMSADYNLKHVNALMLALEEDQINYVKSVTNFVLIDCGGENGEIAHQVCTYLEQKGVIVRPVTAYGLPNHVRVGIGVPQANKIVLESLPEIKKMIDGHRQS